MVRCINCGESNIGMWEFRGRVYCKKHYQEHLDAEAETLIYFDGFMQALRDMKPGKKNKLRGKV